MSMTARLIYNPRTSRWLLRRQGSFWIVRLASDALVLAGFLKLEILKSGDPIATDNAQGIATVRETEDGCSITLRNFIGSEEPQRIEFNAKDSWIATFECDYGLFDDLWVASRAQFQVENVETLRLKVFLPRNPSNRGKKLSALKDGEAVGAPTLLSRGVVQEVVLNLRCRGSEAVLDLVSEHHEELDTADQRLLGFRILEYAYDDNPWEPAEGLLE